MIFELTYSWYEEHHYHLFEAPDKTQEEWEDDCKKAIQEVGEAYIEQGKNGWVSADQWIVLAAQKLSEYGYTPVRSLTWGYWGPSIIERDDDAKWEGIVGKNLHSKALAKNKELRAEMDKEILE